MNNTPETSVSLTGWKRRLAHLIWALMLLAGLSVTGITLLVHLRLVPLQAPEILAQYGPQDAQERVNLLLFATLIPAVYSLAGLFIFWRKQDDPFGLLVSYTLISAGTALLTADWVAIESYNSGLVLVLKLLQVPSFTALYLLFLLFPNGRFVPGWTRWVAMLIPLPVIAFEFSTNTSVSSVVAASMILLFIVGLVAQIIRYRTVSNAVQRQQTKWIIVGLGALVAGVVAWMAVSFIMPEELAFLLPVLPLIGVLTVGVLPITLALSIMRYRLWDIDVVIRRTLVYSTITAVLALVYLGGVTLIQAVFHNVTGSKSTLAVVASTLAIATLFNPLRHRVQEMVDRRFYRSKYDAQQTVDAFALAVRDEVDIERLQASLLEVVEETMQPEHVSLWLPE